MVLGTKNFTILVGIMGFCAFSCTPNKLTKVGKNNGSSNMKSVKINQPDLKKEMKASVKDEDKTKVYDSLVYSIVISANKKDGKEECNDGIKATSFDSGIIPVSKNEFADIKVVRGCSYLVSMKIGAVSEDKKSIKTLYLSSWDDKDASILSKEELEKDKPNVAVKLYVTADGKSFWDAESIVTPTDADTTVNPTIVKSGKVTAHDLEVALDAGTDVLSGKVEVTPKSANSADLYCAVGIKSELGNDTLVKKMMHIFKKKDKTFDEVMLKIPANSTAKETVSGLSVKLPAASGLTNINSSKPYVYCDADKAKAELHFDECLVKEASTNAAVSCDDTSIVE